MTAVGVILVPPSKNVAKCAGPPGLIAVSAEPREEAQGRTHAKDNLTARRPSEPLAAKSSEGPRAAAM